MPARRRLLAASSSMLALTALTGCEKPAPLVTLVSGGKSVYTEANVYCFEEDKTLEDDCAERAQGPTRLEIRPGAPIGVDVGKELVERGWRVQFGSGNDPNNLSPVLKDKHYSTFAVQELPAEGAAFTIYTVNEEEATTGRWLFQLVPKD